MKISYLAVALLALAVSGCNKPTPVSLSGVATRTITQADNSSFAQIEAVSVKRNKCAIDGFCGVKEVTFTGGPQAGRTITFDTDAMPTNLADGETGFLKEMSLDGAGTAYLIGIQTSETSDVYAVYSNNGSDLTGEKGSLSYVGDMKAYGQSPTGSGQASGTFSAFVALDSSKVIGQMNDIKFDNGGTFPIIRFTADIEGKTGTFYADTLQIEGTPPSQGHLEGAITLNENLMNGVFGVNSGDGPKSTTYGLTGIFLASPQDTTAQ